MDVGIGKVEIADRLAVLSYLIDDVDGGFDACCRVCVEPKYEMDVAISAFESLAKKVCKGPAAILGFPCLGCALAVYAARLVGVGLTQFIVVWDVIRDALGMIWCVSNGLLFVIPSIFILGNLIVLASF